MPARGFVFSGADAESRPTVRRRTSAARTGKTPRGFARHGSVNASIQVDVSRRTLSLYLDSALYRVYPIAVGKPSTPTPPGDWRIKTKVIDPGGALGTRWMGLDVPWGNYGIHGTNNPSSIGHAVSNGCIRMYNSDVEEVFDLVGLGTPVHISSPAGSAPDVPVLLRRGSTGPAVVRIQRTLAGLSMYEGEIDGIFGPLTEEAVVRFQLANGLNPDGVVGAETWARLASVRRHSTPPPYAPRTDRP